MLRHHQQALAFVQISQPAGRDSPLPTLPRCGAAAAHWFALLEPQVDDSDPMCAPVGPRVWQRCGYGSRGSHLVFPRSCVRNGTAATEEKHGR